MSSGTAFIASRKARGPEERVGVIAPYVRRPGKRETAKPQLEDDTQETEVRAKDVEERETEWKQEQW